MATPHTHANLGHGKNEKYVGAMFYCVFVTLKYSNMF